MNYSFTDMIHTANLNIKNEDLCNFYIKHPLDYIYFFDDVYIGYLSLEVFRNNHYRFEKKLLKDNLIVVNDYEVDAYLFENILIQRKDKRILVYSKNDDKYRELFEYTERSIPFEIQQKINASYVLSEFQNELNQLFYGKKVGVLIDEEYESTFLMNYTLITDVDDFEMFDVILDASISKEDEEYYYRYNNVISCKNLAFELLIVRLYDYILNNHLKLYVYDVPKDHSFSLNDEERRAIEYKKDIVGAFQNEDYINKVFNNPIEKEKVLNVGAEAYNSILIDDYAQIRKVTGSKVALYTIKDNKRVTKGNNIHYINSVHMFGPCITFGLFSSNENTIESLLQKIINKAEIRFNVNNYGVPDGGDIVNDILYMLSILKHKNDILVWINRFSKNEKKIIKQYFEIDDISKYFVDKHYYFINDTIHLTAQGNSIVANNIFNKMEFKNDETIINSTTLLYEKTDNRYYHYLEKEKVFGFNKYGAIVIHANPFTLGHRYLIEKALQYVDFLYIFLVENSSKSIPYYERYIIAKHSIDDIKNVKILSAGDYFASEKSFNAYFFKNNDFDAYKHIEFFKKIVIPTLNIQCRFLGSEPSDELCRKFNDYCISALQNNEFKVYVIERKLLNSNAISASTARKLLESHNLSLDNNIISNWATIFLKQKEKQK